MIILDPCLKAKVGVIKMCIHINMQLTDKYHTINNGTLPITFS